MSSLTNELVLAVHADPLVTAERWAQLCPDGPPHLDETFLFHCYSHHVSGIAYDAILELGWLPYLPPFLYTVLSRSAGLSEAVWDAHYQGLVELAEAEPELIRGSLVVKGALLGLLYPSKRHRVMGDFDLILAPDQLQPMLTLLRKLGYEQQSDMAHDYIKTVGPVFSGAGRVAMHVWEMPKGWEAYQVAGTVGEVACQVPTPDLHLTELLLNAHEHASSWYYALWESDLQLVRALDVELICDSEGGVDPHRLWRTATDVGMQAEIALGIWVHEQLRGSLPAGWEALRPVIDAVAPYGDMFAMPKSVEVDEHVRTWPLSVRERAFHPSRHDLALEQLPASQRTLEFVGAMKDGRVSRQQPTHRIAELARGALAGVTPLTGGGDAR